MTNILHALLNLQARFVGEDHERGATAVEYALMVALIAVVIILVVATLGTSISSEFSKVANSMP